MHPSVTVVTMVTIFSLHPGIKNTVTTVAYRHAF